MITGSTRKFFRRLHLYIGVGLGAIFVILGLTGSLIAWLPELDAALNPELLQSSAGTSSKPRVHPSAALQAVVDKLSNDPQYGRPAQIWLPTEHDEVFIAWYAPAKSKNTSAFDQMVSRQVMVDPYTLQIKGERNWGEAGLSRALFMPTLFHLHHYLLAGDAGKLSLAISGVLLLIITIVGITLWWPKMKWRSVKQALSIAYGGSWARFNYSSHRAIGFYAAPVFLVLAVSGIYLNFPNWIIPIVNSAMTVSAKGKISNEAIVKSGLVTAAGAVDIARTLYPDAKITRIALPTDASTPFEIRVRQMEEIQDSGATRVSIDSHSGKVLRIIDPLRASSGDVFLSWQFPLHSGQAFGNAGKVFISLFGLMPLFFALTGIYIWLKRKK
jgi:uncharacterized iron-regulated membrane protein